ncbi:hypothetical protein CH063_12195 [Colletotrichum higginsianum]|uniref:Uncharacterized protein n=1 Tax=Colletotrichum higginsianum (strain IMI 349063) TaxID=759273 RepID=H1VPF8_COLHI|nr:hypothetical protein CH063_12195 [Colletotrichum higginsianum]
MLLQLQLRPSDALLGLATLSLTEEVTSSSVSAMSSSSPLYFAAALRPFFEEFPWILVEASTSSSYSAFSTTAAILVFVRAFVALCAGFLTLLAAGGRPLAFFAGGIFCSSDVRPLLAFAPRPESSSESESANASNLDARAARDIRAGR